jgi:DNA polymerase III epsilon subunit family exonuclease
METFIGVSILFIVVYYVFIKPFLNPTLSVDNIFYSTYNEGLGIQSFNCIEHFEAIPNEYLILDIETTGLSEDSDRIVEIGILHISDNNILSKYHTYINPEIEIPEFITKINGVTNSVVKDKPKIYDVINEIHDFIKGKVIVGYNVEFDLNFLDVNFNRGNILVEEVKYFDVLRLVRQTIHPSLLQNRKLETVKKYLSIDGNSHRAIDDCIATGKVLLRCIKILEDEKLKNRQEQDLIIQSFDEHESEFYNEFLNLITNDFAKNEITISRSSNKAISFRFNRYHIGTVKLQGRKYEIQTYFTDDTGHTMASVTLKDKSEAKSHLNHWVNYTMDMYIHIFKKS